MVKTGECCFRDEAGALWLAESFTDADGNVSTQQIEIEPAPPAQAGAAHVELEG